MVPTRRNRDKTLMQARTDRLDLERRVEELERQVRDVEEWLSEVAADVLDREGVA